MCGAIADRISEWLLSSEIQFRNGPEAGGIAGWIDANRRAAFAYPEVTGYYLTWLAFMGALGTADRRVVDNANMALAWLRQKSHRNRPILTRYYLDREFCDWHNYAIFSFDLAMTIRGIASIRGMVPGGEDCLDHLLDHARCCCLPGGILLPYLPNGYGDLPRRWSTLEGPYQLKTAAALLFSCKEVPANLCNCAERVYRQWARRPMEYALESLHGTFYALEGLLLFAQLGRFDDWETVAVTYDRSVELLNSRATDYEIRSDVLAQALRLGCILRDQEILGPDCYEKLHQLAIALGAFVGKEGSVAFHHTHKANVHWNAWSSMFAHQALVFFERLRNGQPLKDLIQMLI